jgi:hypothetical protein
MARKRLDALEALRAANRQVGTGSGPAAEPDTPQDPNAPPAKRPR